MQRLGIVLCVVGVAFVVFVGLILTGYLPNLKYAAQCLWLAPVGGYFIYLGVALYRRISPGLVHQMVSVFTVCIAAIMVILVMQSGVGGRGLRAVTGIACFFLIAAIHKSILRRIGRVAFGREIVE